MGSRQAQALAACLWACGPLAAAGCGSEVSVFGGDSGSGQGAGGTAGHGAGPAGGSGAIGGIGGAGAEGGGGVGGEGGSPMDPCSLGTNSTECLGACPAHLWSHGFGDESIQIGRDVAVDGAGNAILTGEFGGELDFGIGALGAPVPPGWSPPDVFVAKLDPSGQPLWSQQYGDGPVDEQSGTAIAVNPSGGLALAGWFRGSLSFGDQQLWTNSYQDGFMAMLYGAGVPAWAHAVPAASTSSGVRIHDVATASWNNVVVVGNRRDAQASNNVFVGKYGADGLVWGHQYGDDSVQFGRAVAVHPSGQIIVVGEFEGQLSFGDGPVLISAGAADVFVAKLASDGSHLWSARFGDQHDQGAQAVAVDVNGYIVLGGRFEGQLDFGGAALDSGPGESDAFVAKLTPDGDHLWSLGIGDEAEQRVQDVAFDPAGNVLVAVQAGGTVDLGGGPLTSDDSIDVVVGKLSTAGNHVWSQRFGGMGNQFINGVATDTAGNVVLVGSFSCETDFGGGTLSSGGLADVFVAKLSP